MIKKIMTTSYISLEFDDKQWDLFMEDLIPTFKIIGHIEDRSDKVANEEEDIPDIPVDIVINDIVIPGALYYNNHCKIEATAEPQLSTKLTRITQYLLGWMDEEKYLLYGNIFIEDKEFMPILIVYYKDMDIAIYTIEEEPFTPICPN